MGICENEAALLCRVYQPTSHCSPVHPPLGHIFDIKQFCFWSKYVSCFPAFVNVVVEFDIEKWLSINICLLENWFFLLICHLIGQQSRPKLEVCRPLLTWPYSQLEFELAWIGTLPKRCRRKSSLKREKRLSTLETDHLHQHEVIFSLVINE